MDSDFKVKVGEFEGPLDLLLELIEKRKLHISDVTLSKVADEFIEHVRSYEEFPIADSADFILIASTLLLIKSKSLLPSLTLTEEEESNIHDLEERLEKYKKYKELAQQLGKMFGNFLYFAGERPVNNKLVFFNPSRDISIDSLSGALAAALKNLPAKATALPKVAVEKVISLEEMIDRLSQRIQASIKTSFSDFAKASPDKRDFSNMDKAEKVNVIISFLAMLELVKQGAVRVNQANHFEDIEIESENVSVPSYQLL